MFRFNWKIYVRLTFARLIRFALVFVSRIHTTIHSLFRTVGNERRLPGLLRAAQCSVHGIRRTKYSKNIHVCACTCACIWMNVGRMIENSFACGVTASRAAVTANLLLFTGLTKLIVDIWGLCNKISRIMKSFVVVVSVYLNMCARTAQPDLCSERSIYTIKLGLHACVRACVRTYVRAVNILIESLTHTHTLTNSPASTFNHLTRWIQKATEWTIQFRYVLPLAFIARAWHTKHRLWCG